MTARVLLIEDEEVVRTLVRQVLELRGYEVIEAATPEEAIALDVSEVDVLLTDVVMPGMRGPDVAAKLVQANPALKVLFMSGYTDDLVLRHGVADGTTWFLQKPFTAGELGEKLLSVLEEPLARI